VAASDAWTLSYRELMDDVDEQRLEVLDLPPDLQRQAPWIVAVLPNQKKRRSSRTEPPPDGEAMVEKQTALKLFKAHVQRAFERKQEMRADAEEMTRWLSRFPYSYHVSDYAPRGSSEIRRTWFAGRANLEVTSNGNLLGVFTLGNPTVKSLKVRVFGRPVPHHNRTVWHLQWHGMDQRAESGTTNLVVSTSDLKEGRVLVGSWVGRSSWTSDDVRPSGGPFILHTQADMTASELGQLMQSYQDQSVPDLRQLSNEMITLTPHDSPVKSRPYKDERTPRKSRFRKPR